jgi:hypothetical protein
MRVGRPFKAATVCHGSRNRVLRLDPFALFNRLFRRIGSLIEPCPNWAWSVQMVTVGAGQALLAEAVDLNATSP